MWNSQSHLRSILWSACMMCAIPGMAQPPEVVKQTAKQGRVVPDGKPMEFAESYDRRFARRSPLVGQQLPKLRLLDAKGERFDIRKSDGAYRVLVFGCLT